MTQNCRPAKCIEAIRVTLLDQCTLQPVCGPLNGYAMGCIIEPNWTPEIEEGEESIVKDNCGNICLRDDRCDLVKRWNLEFKIKDPDKEFLALIEGNPLIVDGGGNSIGVRQLAYGACSPYVFFEMFERTDNCQVDGEAVYLRHVFPAVRLKWTGNEREGVFRILQIEGKTRPKATDQIGTGPYFDIPPGVIVGASSTETIDYVWFEDDFVPAVQCGAITVPCPDPTPTTPLVAYDCETDTLTIDTDGDADVTYADADEVQFTAAAPGTLTYPADFARSATTITVTGASALLGAGPLTELSVFNSVDALIDTWTGAVDLTYPCAPAAPGFRTFGAPGGTAAPTGGLLTYTDVDSLGRVYLGHHVTVAGVERAIIWRVLADGSIDGTYGTGGYVILQEPIGSAYDDLRGIAVDVADDSLYVSVQDNTGVTRLIKLTSAGILDVGFDGDGIVVLATSVEAVFNGVIVEPGGNVTIAFNEAAGVGRLSNYTSAGVVVAESTFPADRSINGLAYAGTPLQYRGVTYDGSGGTAIRPFSSTIGGAMTEGADIDSVYGRPGDSGFAGAVVDPGTLDLYLSGRDEVGSIAAIIRVNAALALDAGWGTGGRLEFPDGSVTTDDFSRLQMLAGGDLIAVGGGNAASFDNNRFASGRADSTGVVDTTYSLTGVEFRQPDANAIIARLSSMHLVEGGGYFYAAGSYYDVVTNEVYPVIQKQSIADGSLVTDFG